MKMVRVLWGWKAEAPEVPTMAQLRRAARFMRRGFMNAKIKRYGTDEKGWPTGRIDDPADAPPFAWTFTTDRAEHMRIDNDPYPYAIVPDDGELWEAMERMGFNPSLLTTGRWDGNRVYLARVELEDRTEEIEATGPSREAALFTAVLMLERLTRRWRYSCGHSGLYRPSSAKEWPE